MMNQERNSPQPSHPFIRGLEERSRDGLVELRTRLVRRCGGEVPVSITSFDTANNAQVSGKVRAQPGAAMVPMSIGEGRRAVLVMEGPLIQRLVGRLLGETPETEGHDYSMRALTRLDVRMVSRLGEDFAGALQQLLGGVDPVTCDPCVSGPRAAVPGFAEDGRSALMTFDFGDSDEPWGLAWLALEIDESVAQAPAPVPTANASRRVMDVERVMPIGVEVTAELARTHLTLGKLKDLQVGDTINFGRVGEVTLRLGERPVFVGEAGESGGAVSVRIVNRV